MKRKIVSLGAVLFLAIGFVIGYAVNLSVGPGAASAADQTVSTSNTTVSAPAVSSTSINAGIEQAFQTIQKSVVFVDNLGTGTGSGIIYNANGDIVTNDHVVSGGSRFRVTFYNGKSVKATVVGVDPADDLAVLHVNVSGLHPATFAPASSFRLAETVLAVGSPLGLQDSVTDGLISGLNRTEEEPTGSYIPDAIQTSAPINPGNSGGALVALNGDVVGIPTIVQTSDSDNTPVQNVGFAIPSSRVTFIVPQIIKYGRVTNTGRAFLGVSVGDSTGGYSPFGGQSTVAGAVIETIKSGGPAASAGLQEGDVIVRFNGLSIGSSDDLLEALAQVKPSQLVTVKYNRNGADHTTRVTLGKLPATQ